MPARASQISSRLVRLNTGLLLGSLALIALIVLTQGFPPWFDEPLFQANCFLYETYGLSAKFLQEMRGQAPGPLYQILHGLVSPITGYDIRGMRLVNLAVFLAALWVSYRLYRRVWPESRAENLFTTASIFLFPVTWVCAGLAITQAPSWLFAALAVLLMLQPLPTPSRMEFLGLAGRGACIGLSLGVAALGRVTYLAIWPVMLFLIVRYWPERRRYFVITTASAVACAAVVLPVVRVWGGLVPPDQRTSFMRDAAYLNIMPVLVAFVYLFLVMLWMNPASLRLSRRGLGGVAVGFVVLLLLNLLGIGVRHNSEILDRFTSFASPSPALMSLLPFPLYGALTLWVAIAIGGRLLDRWADVPYVVVALAGLLVLGSVVKSTKMGPTYLFQALPFLLPLITKNQRQTVFLSGRVVLSLIMGAMTLRYFMSDTWL